MQAQADPNVALKAAYDQLPRSSVRYLGAQFDRVSPGAAGTANLEHLRKLLQEASESRFRLTLLLRTKGVLNVGQQAAWDSDLKSVRDCINQANDLFSRLEKPKLSSSGMSGTPWPTRNARTQQSYSTLGNGCCSVLKQFRLWAKQLPPKMKPR